MLKRTLTQGLRLILSFCVVFSMLTGCGKPKTPQLLPMPELPMQEPPTVEAEPEHESNLVVGIFVFEMAMLPGFIIMMQPNPMLILRAITAWLSTPQRLVRIVGSAGIIGITAYGVKKKLRRGKEEAR